MIRWKNGEVRYGSFERIWKPGHGLFTFGEIVAAFEAICHIPSNSEDDTILYTATRNKGTFDCADEQPLFGSYDHLNKKTFCVEFSRDFEVNSPDKILWYLAWHWVIQMNYGILVYLKAESQIKVLKTSSKKSERPKPIVIFRRTISSLTLCMYTSAKRSRSQKNTRD